MPKRPALASPRLDAYLPRLVKEEGVAGMHSNAMPRCVRVRLALGTLSHTHTCGMYGNDCAAACEGLRGSIWALDGQKSTAALMLAAEQQRNDRMTRTECTGHLRIRVELARLVSPAQHNMATAHGLQKREKRREVWAPQKDDTGPRTWARTGKE